MFNNYGDYGSRYSSTSMWNRYGDYGSRYSDVSACSTLASDPPIVVDRDGRDYGRVTLNTLQPSTPALRMLAQSICSR